MFVLTPGSHVCRLIEILAIVGEFPMASRYLLGKERFLYTLCYELHKVQDYKIPNTGERYRCQLIQLSGRGRRKSIRFHKRALPLLEYLDPILYRFYMEAYSNHHFRTDEEHSNRNHRVAEAAAMCLLAGIEARPNLLPILSKEERTIKAFENPCFYLGKTIKKLDIEGLNKLRYARFTGLLFYRTGCYTVYNTGEAVMKMTDEGERKVQLELADLCALNTQYDNLRSCLFLGRDYPVALKILNSLDDVSNSSKTFFTVYHSIHFIPVNDFGVRLIRILTQPNGLQTILKKVFRGKNLSGGAGDFPYDAEGDGVFYLNFLDGDINKLRRFRQYVPENVNWCVVSYPEQLAFLQEYLGTNARIKLIEISMVEKLLRIERRNLLSTTRLEKLQS